MGHSPFKTLSIGILICLLPGCSIFHVIEDTKQERFPSKNLNEAKNVVLYTPELLNVQAPSVRPVVGVYPTAFTDQTGQRKSNSEFALFSTAITQSPSSLLVHALKHTSNGEFFVVVERQNLDSLTKERQLIRSTRDQLVNADGEKKELMPLLFAGVLFDGAVVSYDTNILSGGLGSRWLGVGKSVRYKMDQVTVSLRMISTSTGEILLETMATKTIYSYGQSEDVFRFYDMQTQLLEIEVGNAENEATTIALQKAIESALYEIISQGYERRFWKHD